MPRKTAQPHPLAPYVGQITPQQTYTLRELAALMEMSPSSLGGLVSHGLFPGGRFRPHTRGGRQHVWSGAQLVRMAGRPVRVAFDHDQFAPSTLYRVGCRCLVCMVAHTSESRERRRALAEATFTADQREHVVRLVAGGMLVHEAAKKVGVTPGQVYGRANWDAAYAEEIDEAGWSLCVLGPDDPACSTASGYRGNPRGKTPRPACRATGCREWRRDYSREERADA